MAGPTEALRGRPGGSGTGVRQGAVPGLPDDGHKTGWQLSQRVWEDSGVAWEDPGVDSGDQPAPDPDGWYPDDPAGDLSDPRPPGPDKTSPCTSPPLSAPVALPLGEPDELFRAWQGSVNKAAGRRTPRTARRPAGTSEARNRKRGWQTAKIGVPAAVIITVGAGALMMLTGRANEMLAQRASGGALSPGKPASGPVASRQTSVRPSSPARPGASADSLPLAGYPAEHGSAEVAALWTAGGTTMAVGAADGHPAVWRHAAGGTWTLVSTAVLGGVTGHLTSAVRGSSGWIAVGSVKENGTVEPAVFASADGVSWRQLTALTAIAGGGAQFVGVAAGPRGYLVVGKQGTGKKERADFWWSADLENWVGGNAKGTPSHAAAAVATADGFVAVGTQSHCHTLWASADGRHWTTHDVAKPSGATSAILRSVTANAGGRLVAAGSAAGRAGEIPIVVTSADNGAHVTQAVLSSPGGSPATATAVTATSDGFVAVGQAGPPNAQHAVTWTSPDGLTWSPATPLLAAGASEVTALTTMTGTTLTATAQRGTAPALLTVPAP